VAENVACGKAHQAPRIAKKNTACAWQRPAAAPGCPRSRTKIASRNISVNATNKDRGNLNRDGSRVFRQELNLSIYRKTAQRVAVN